MITKQQLIKLNNEFDSNLLIKDIKKCEMSNKLTHLKV